MIQAVGLNYVKQLQELLPNCKIELCNVAKRPHEKYHEYVVYVDGQLIPSSNIEGFIMGVEFAQRIES